MSVIIDKLFRAREQELIEKFLDSFDKMWYKIAEVMCNWSESSEYHFPAEQHIEINDVLDVFKKKWEGKLKE